MGQGKEEESGEKWKWKGDKGVECKPQEPNSCTAFGLFTKRALTSNFQDLPDFAAEYEEMRQNFLVCPLSLSLISFLSLLSLISSPYPSPTSKNFYQS
jgi:hypothetical protein